MDVVYAEHGMTMPVSFENFARFRSVQLDRLDLWMPVDQAFEIINYLGPDIRIEAPFPFGCFQHIP